MLSRRYLEDLRPGDVIAYRSKIINDDMYLIVERVKDGRVYGQIASGIRVNSFSIEDLAKLDPTVAERWELIRPKPRP
ncbi:MAG: hypothetical protein ABH817_00685 [archaeon]